MARPRYGVMISSTWSDFEDKRQEIMALLKRHDLYDVAMENTAARPTMDKIDSSLAMVDEAHAYVCLIGHRYGSRQFCENRNPTTFP